ncbi:hypothetical protein [Bacillus siamensis]|uniref:hypothetical protein n=1 Tax=Bacillus siamensis TaxID=659243 RepID=UPI003F68D61D
MSVGLCLFYILFFLLVVLALSESVLSVEAESDPHAVKEKLRDSAPILNNHSFNVIPKNLFVLSLYRTNLPNYKLHFGILGQSNTVVW